MGVIIGLIFEVVVRICVLSHDQECHFFDRSRFIQECLIKILNNLVHYSTSLRHSMIVFGGLSQHKSSIRPICLVRTNSCSPFNMPMLKVSTFPWLGGELCSYCFVFFYWNASSSCKRLVADIKAKGLRLKEEEESLNL